VVQPEPELLASAAPLASVVSLDLVVSQASVAHLDLVASVAYLDLAAHQDLVEWLALQFTLASELQYLPDLHGQRHLVR
jgi:hypothetical protein